MRVEQNMLKYLQHQNKSWVGPYQRQTDREEGMEEEGERERGVCCGLTGSLCGASRDQMASLLLLIWSVASRLMGRDSPGWTKVCCMGMENLYCVHT